MKRGTTDYSLVVGIDKPRGMTSHDVVNRVRRIFGERRVGHTGTLDPLAEGVLPVCVGPATRLGAYLTGHDKRYRVRIAFGVATETDDSEGTILRRGDIPREIEDPGFAELFVSTLVGKRKQLPPVYSAVKVDGKKSYEAARKGNVIDLTPRDIEVFEARLIGMGRGYPLPGSGRDAAAAAPGAVLADPAAMDPAADPAATADPAAAQQADPGSVRGEGAGPWCDLPWWDVEFHVSKGTYIRSLARDAGNALGCPAHVCALKRTRSGLLDLEDCVTLETLEEVRERAALDPIRLLGLRFAYADGPLSAAVANGAALRADEVELFVRRRAGALAEMCACTAGVVRSCEPVSDGESIAVISENKLAALYEYDGGKRLWRARCVFQKGVLRGSCI